MKKKENYPIDAIIYWVDGNDKEWLREKEKYQGSSSNFTDESAGSKRYRDWENLQFLFRGIEKFMPWINKVYFVTCGQIPEWLNVKHPKLRVVNHKDYIPSKYLPTFSANPIELNFHRIPELSECFIVFNDDFFVLDEIDRMEFFKNKKPVDIFMEYPIMCGGNAPLMGHILCNGFNLIGKYFLRNEYKKRLRRKILSPKYGWYVFYNCIQWLIPYPRFYGVLTPHFARPYLKSSYEKLWANEQSELDRVCLNKFRSAGDINIYAIRNFNLLEGNFVPGNVFKMGKFLLLDGKSNTQEIQKIIEKQKYKLICLNDECSDEFFEETKQSVNASFRKILPEKSNYEI